MTKLSDELETMGTNLDEPPEVSSDQDTPFNSDDSALGRDVDLSAQERIFDWKRLNIGSNVLGWCIFLMMVCVILSIFVPDSSLLKDAFEAFKLIVVSVLGYIFGSNAKK